MGTTLIGGGGHADDIYATRTVKNRVAHHSLYVPDGGPVIIGINDPQLRAKIAADLGVEDLPWIHPDAKLYTQVRWGYGTHINYAATMTRTTIGTHTTVAPGVTICGDVTIGDRCMIGAGATICEKVTIGDDVIIGAGAVVLPKMVIGSNVTMMGVPATRWMGGR